MQTNAPSQQPGGTDSHNNMSEGQSAGSPQWPGERHPTRWDVHDANECLATSFLEQYKTMLQHSEEAQASRWLIPPPSPEEDELQAQASGRQPRNGVDNVLNPARLYTYPMALLTELPSIPDEKELVRLQSLFFTSFKLHIYLAAIDIPDTTQSHHPPYFPLALACLSSAVSRSPNLDGYDLGANNSPEEISASLFIAGLSLWCVVLEVDNREARLLEAVVAASLLSTYGILSADRGKWRKSLSLLSNTATISRRLHLSDGYYPISTPAASSDRKLSMQSSLMSYMLLTDVISALHCDATPNFSTTELSIKMPSSSYQFRTIYALIRSNSPLPEDVRCSEDGLLLLTALLNDIIYMQRCYPLNNFASTGSAGSISSSEAPLRNPYAPLSLVSERSRLNSALHAALDRWKEHFQQTTGKVILALFYFCKLQLTCSDIWELPSLAEYMTSCSSGTPSTTSRGGGRRILEIPDQAIDLAWLVVDNCNMQSETLGNQSAIWLPVVLFHSALVIWQRLRFRSPKDNKYGTLKILSMFKNEIAQLPWACCSEMQTTLDRLMNE